MARLGTRPIPAPLMERNPAIARPGTLDSYFDLKKQLGWFGGEVGPAGVAAVCRILRQLAGQGRDLDEVVGQDSVSVPDIGSVPAVQAGAVPAVVVLEVADPSLRSGPPFDELAEAGFVLGGLAGGRGGPGVGWRGSRHRTRAGRLITG